MRVLITGATGYLGATMRETAPDGVEVIPLGFSRGAAAVDVTDRAATADCLTQHSPDVVVHLAAVSEVARAGADAATASSVNAAGTGNVAAAAAGLGARLVVLSSDVVFDGASGPYSEDSVPNPINAYGRSKLAGEQAAVEEHPQALIVRTSVLVGRDRTDRHPFSAFVLERAAAGKRVELFENELRNFFPVTSAAHAVWECATGDLVGVLHVAGLSALSRFEFGRRLMEAAGHDPSLAVATTGPADRPADLTLDVGRAAETLATPLPDPDQVIEEVLADIERPPPVT